MLHAIVTGAGGGIGSAIARKLSENGYRVAVCDQNLQAADEVAWGMENAIAIKVDVTDTSSVKQMVETFGAPVDLLVNNAGLHIGGGLEQDEVSFRRILDVNLVGPYIVSRAVLPGMLDRGRGAIVNITSVAGLTAAMRGGAYAPSKAGLSNLTKSMALEVAGRGVRINAVAPGMIETGMGSASFDDPARRAFRESVSPMGTLGTGEQVADAVLFLGSDRASYITGQELCVDAGLSLTAINFPPR